MGDLGMSSHSPPNASPSGMAWTPSPTSGLSENYVVVPGEGNIAPYIATPNTPINSDSPPGSFLQYPPYNSYPTSNSSPPHLPALPSPGTFSDHFAYQQRAGGVTPNIPPPMSGSPLGIPMPISPGPSSSRLHHNRAEDENRMLRSRLRDLELMVKSSRHRERELEHELNRITYGGSHATATGLLTPMASPATSVSFNESWRSRTEARVKLFCSLNRAGNALCAWHDSRRERRAHPPRMAPPGHLNCGCTYEEALFEESLARHNVGSYHPGENVRMDPALRNPLLKLLQERYGYRDGDFERDSLTGDWLENEGPSRWEAKVASGGIVSKKHRT